MKSESVICTLFEGQYHKGVAAFVNSLHKCGYKGSVYAGYRGTLPKWANKAAAHESISNPDVKTLFIENTISLHFVSLNTEYHFANYKPDFMKWVAGLPENESNNVFYFDPDIVVCYKWDFFEEWANYGIALCEDVNSPLAINHPRRLAWNKYFNDKGIKPKFREISYANSGFIGINKKDRDFILYWIDVQEKIAPLIGGLSRSPFQGKHILSEEHCQAYFPFSKTDQDALNVTVGTWNGVVSFVGKEGMGFQPGAKLMVHALATPKPWNARYLIRIFLGFRPGDADKYFWQSATYPIKAYPKAYAKWKNVTVKIAAFIGRFYGRS